MATRLEIRQILQSKGIKVSDAKLRQKITQLGYDVTDGFDYDDDKQSAILGAFQSEYPQQPPSPASSRPTTNVANSTISTTQSNGVMAAQGLALQAQALTGLIETIRGQKQQAVEALSDVLVDEVKSFAGDVAEATYQKLSEAGLLNPMDCKFEVGLPKVKPVEREYTYVERFLPGQGMTRLALNLPE
ncbi:MAG: hypothetical protein F6K19_40570 [Cyanothece sp. SIO1E1]|nr:hypothetical protein [Cyanothece sp. SIO1E1]